jgi:NADPH2:quinone reductase
MTISSHETALQLQSLVTKSGRLEVSLVRAPVPVPKEDEVLVRIEATPLNPSDLGLLFGAADMNAMRVTGHGAEAVLTAPIPAERMAAMAGRVDQAMPVGNEGAGVVVAAGDLPEARSLVGKTVAILGGAMYTQYRAIKARQCLVLPPGATAADGASCFVNPLTSQGMVETMRMEGHKALVHTAAASNLGQMLTGSALQTASGW